MSDSGTSPIDIANASESVDSEVPPTEIIALESGELNKSNWKWRALPIAAATVFVILTIRAAWLETPTIDEFVHVPAGCAALKFHDFSVSPKTPPLFRYFMALPVIISGANVPDVGDIATSRSPWASWDYGTRFMNLNSSQFFKLFFRARVATILLTLMTALLIFHCGTQIFDVRVAAIASALFCLDPSVLAHGHLATVDIACALTFLLSLMAMRWASINQSQFRFAVAGAVWGIAMLVKFTSIILPAMLIVPIIFGGWRKPLRMLLNLCAFFAVALLTINALMLFQGSFKRLSEYKFVSSPGELVQSRLPAWTPVPLPEQFLRGFDVQAYETQHGEFESFLNGTWSRQRMPWYNFVALAVKLPPLILFSLLAVPYFLWRSSARNQDLIFILLPSALLIFIASRYSSLNIGIRYLLPIFPLLYLCVASVWGYATRWKIGRLVTAIVFGGSLWAAIDSHPNHLAYFNVFGGGPEQGHKILLDSNIDWGQDLYRVQPALAKMGSNDVIRMLYFGHVDPSLYGIKYELCPSWPVNDIVVVSVNYLMGFEYPAVDQFGQMQMVSRNHLGWLRSHEPSLKLGSIWIYDLRSKQQ